MKIICPNQAPLTPSFTAPSHPDLVLLEPKTHHCVKSGHYYRQSDQRYVQRYRCKTCGRSFMVSKTPEDYRLKRRDIHDELTELLASGVSQRRAAFLLKVDRKTVARKLVLLSKKSQVMHQKFLNHFIKTPLERIQFDDLETSQHTKCKPLSVSVAVDPSTRKILAIRVSEMPAKGKLAAISVKKYGPREDKRAQGWSSLFKDIVPYLKPNVVIESDESPHYPKYIRAHLPDSKHIRYPGGRGAITGQGELKKKVYDPLFALNHTCAMFRANMNRLFRRTWCTTKSIEGLTNHLWLYAHFHNSVLCEQ